MVAQLAARIRQSEKSHGERFHHSVTIDVELRMPHDVDNYNLASFDVSAVENLPSADDIAQEIIKTIDLHFDGIYCSPESATSFAEQVLTKATSIHRFFDKDPLPESKAGKVSTTVSELLK